VLKYLLAASISLPILLAQPPKTGEDLIREMHDKYKDQWYQTLTFVQKTTHEDGRVETWYEAAKIPGYLRIDIAPVDSGNAIIFRHDSIVIFRNKKQVNARAFVHPLMVLGFDVYRQPPDVVIGKLKDMKIDLSKLREDTWQGRAVYVVGADKGDTTTSQFWVDKERLVTMRLLEATPQGVTESQFNNYQRLGHGWIAPEMEFWRAGKMVVKEEYDEIRGDLNLPEELWTAAEYAPPGWVVTPMRRP
jgi:hypothetical protein